MKTAMVKLEELILDFEVYPRTKTDPQHLSQMERAFLAGTKLPPIVICKKSKRIADGFHRYQVYKRQSVEKVEVEERVYKTDADLFADAMRMQSSHGRNLSPFDRSHCAIVAARLGIDDTVLAAALQVDTDYIGELRTDKQALSGKLHVPIKQTIRHMAGKQLTGPQFDVNRRLGGMNQLFYVNQLLMLLENDLIDKENEDLLAGLRKLHEKLEALLVAQ